jgi:hypothetical protein
MTACVQGHGLKPGKDPAPLGEIPRSKVAERAERYSEAKARGPAVGLVGAMKRGNARRAKEPCQRHSEQEREAGVG